MNYFVKRGDQEYGPYTLADLQQYVAEGNISKEDLARSEGMNDWASVASVLGTVEVPRNLGFGAAAPRDAAPLHLPPKFHWIGVVILGIVTVGLFWVIWLFVEAVWVRKVARKSNALWFLVGYLGASVMAGALESKGLAPLFQIGGFVLYLVAIFSMRSSIEEYYDTINPAGTHLSGVMTFFFNAAYFQYHLSEIRRLCERQEIGVAAGLSS